MQMDQQNYSAPNVPPPIPPRQVPPQPQAVGQQAPQGPPKRSGMAIGSLVLGILGVLTCGLSAIVGLILGIVSLVSIRKSLGRLTGQGMAIAGIVVSAVALLVIPAVLLAILIPSLSAARDYARQTVALSNMHQLSMATHMYAAEHDGRLPDPDNWVEQIKPYAGEEIDKLIPMPSSPESGPAFAMNEGLVDRSGKAIVLENLQQSGQTVLFFEAEDGSPLSGGPELLPAEPRGPSGYIILFVDGHVEAIPAGDMDGLIWQPRAP